MRKRKGQVSLAVTLFAMTFAMAVIAVMCQEYLWRAMGRRTEDALAASNLASALVDVREYGATHRILVEDPDSAYALYQDALRYNMQLNEQWMREDALMAGPVEILEYTVYNVRGSDVDVYTYGERTASYTVAGGLGSVAAPTGEAVASTSVYSRITYPVTGLFDIQVDATKEKLVDIVSD